ncbi:EF-hand domain pair [Arabidopsis thaliana x Arabidopsis arenosa]|uniref:EF-hand domain pair n=1 Tax=Arabidopsis thaliana x Arabidopsis arenosa TaxID=1240361 RepID=A0A8T1Y3C8_9BRAS|nr:EF-hand domain pair [Arabidopsis thaliana x Arabidopsis arenosa]
MDMKSNNHQQQQQVLDGSDIVELVENEKVFDKFVEQKFQQLDQDEDGKLSVTELQPAVADIGAALGLPAQGTSPDSDHIYSEWKRDPIVILRMDGEDLSEFVHGPGYEIELVSVFSELSSCEDASLRDCIVKALQSLSVDHGMPPSNDPWVMSNIVEPIVDSCLDEEDKREKSASQEKFLEAFKRVVERVAQRLNEQPVIVAHSENTFDGSGVRRLLSNKFEFDKALNVALETIPKDRHGKVSKEYLRAVLDTVAPSATLPPIGAVTQMDNMIMEALKMVNGDDGNMVKEEEFKKTMAEILGSIMLQLEGNPISVSSNSVVHEPLTSAAFLPPTLNETEEPSN